MIAYIGLAVFLLIYVKCMPRDTSTLMDSVTARDAWQLFSEDHVKRAWQPATQWLVITMCAVCPLLALLICSQQLGWSRGVHWWQAAQTGLGVALCWAILHRLITLGCAIHMWIKAVRTVSKPADRQLTAEQKRRARKRQAETWQRERFSCLGHGIATTSFLAAFLICSLWLDWPQAVQAGFGGILWNEVFLKLDNLCEILSDVRDGQRNLTAHKTETEHAITVGRV